VYLGGEEQGEKKGVRDRKGGKKKMELVKKRSVRGEVRPRLFNPLSVKKSDFLRN